MSYAMSDMNYLIILGGPTCIGKTSMSIQLARRLESEIISADSRQVYKELNIGTAKPSHSELSAIPHHFINHISIFEPYTAGIFEKQAIAFMHSYFHSKSLLIITGGSGLYIKAVCEGLDQFPDVPIHVIDELSILYQENGIEYLQELLLEKDPDYYTVVDLQNPRRLMRALGVIRASGLSYSSFINGKNIERNFTPVYILLQDDRSSLYERINKRVDTMIKTGLVEEARSLYPFKELRSLQTVGYQELFDHFDGKTTLDESIQLIKRNSRRYAKRQITWFKKHGDWLSFDRSDFDGILTSIKNKCI